MVGSNPPGERRQLTLMFCDLVGSTAMSERLDPEDMRDVLVAYREAFTRIVVDAQGSFVNYSGDGIMFAFGYPIARENDAARAVHSALSLIDETKRLSARFSHLADSAIGVRIGIDTGLVIAGALRAGDTVETLSVVGESPNIVARLQTMTEPDTVVLSGATFDLVEGLFECQDLGLNVLKGLTREIRLHRVLRENDAPSRLAARASRGLSPLVGRDRELDEFSTLWASANAGNFTVAMLAGEPGVGKSRLVAEVSSRVREQGATCIEIRCSPFYENSALYPVIGHLKNLFEFGEIRDPAERLATIRRVLSEKGLPLGEMDHLLAALLDVPTSLPPVLSSNPQIMKQKTRDLLIEWLRAAQRGSPLLMIVEDVHWADPSTKEFIVASCGALAHTRVLMVLVHRQDFDTAWMSAHRPARLALGRLDRPDISVVVAHVAKGLALPHSIVEGLVDRAEGIPLFAEELTKAVLETTPARAADAQAHAVRQVAIPATLQDSLMARLDRVTGSREVVQLASTIGREFHYPLLAAAWTADRSQLDGALGELVKNGVLNQLGEIPQATFIFKHALIQDTAYQSMLRERRRVAHKAVANCLAGPFAETVAQSPEVLALHYTEAGDIDSAVPRWHEAAESALRRSAHAEAQHHARRGLQLVTSLPRGVVRDQLELALLVDLGICLTATRGYASPDVGETFGRALEICRRLAKTPRIAAILHGLYRYYFVRSEVQPSLRLGHELLSIGQDLKDDVFVLEAHRCIGNSHMLLSDLAAARHHLGASIELYRTTKVRRHWSQYGVVMDPAVAANSILAIALWLQGFAAQAADVIEEAVAIARKDGHPFGLAWALNYAAVVAQLRGETSKVGSAADACIAVAREHQFPFWIAGGMIMKGWYLNRLSPDKGDGIQLMRDGLKTWRAIGAAIFLPYFLSLLAEALHRSGDIAGGLMIVDEAIEQANTSSEVWWLPDLHRIKGELLAARDGPDLAGAQGCFEAAFGLACDHGAKALELRAALSAYRHSHGAARQQYATRLQDVLSRFTEGLGTADLVGANQALRE